MKTITSKLLFALSAMLSLFLGGMLLANSFLLEKYYVYENKSSFVNLFQIVYKEYSSDPENIAAMLRELGGETGYKYFIVDEENKVQFSSAPEYKSLKQEMTKRQKEYMNQNKKKLNKGEIVYETLNLSNKEYDTVQLSGRLKDKKYLIISQPLKRISENASTANEFFLFIGGIFLLIALMSAFYMSRSLVSPILDITRIAEGIVNTDFSRRYKGTAKDEIGLLGLNMNAISKKLDSTIKELKKANEDLQKEMHLQKRFFASVSHEFKTPVGLIRGYGEALQFDMISTEEEKKEIAGIIIKEADRLNQLVNDIILLVKIDSGIFTINKKKMDIVPILKEIPKKFFIESKKWQVEICTELPENLMIFGDEQRLLQVVENLVSNALCHVNKQGKIRIIARALLKEGCKDIQKEIRVEVMNSGSQLSEKHIPHLFEPFYRVEDSRARKSGGTGLGLSIVKGIVSAHGGDCGVENIEEGVVFWFGVPLYDKYSN